MLQKIVEELAHQLRRVERLVYIGVSRADLEAILEKEVPVDIEGIEIVIYFHDFDKLGFRHAEAVIVDHPTRNSFNRALKTLFLGFDYVWLWHVVESLEEVEDYLKIIDFFPIGYKVLKLDGLEVLYDRRPELNPFLKLGGIFTVASDRILRAVGDRRLNRRMIT